MLLLTRFRIALCIDGRKRFTINKRQLLGKEAIKQRHLRLLGYEVVQVRAFASCSLDVYPFVFNCFSFQFAQYLRVKPFVYSVFIDSFL